VLSALVVDPSPAARRRVGALLRLGGWDVLEAADAPAALRRAAGHDLDLVVTEVALPGETGLALLARLRAAGSRARFLVVTATPTEPVRHAAAGAGALACLTKPVDPRALVDLLRRRAAPPAGRRHLRVVRDVEEAPAIDAATMDRLRGMYVRALPQRLAVIADAVRAADPMAVAAAAQTLAGASGQLGHPQIARTCEDIAAEARRGGIDRDRLRELLALSLRVTGTAPALPQAITRA